MKTLNQARQEHEERAHAVQVAEQQLEQARAKVAEAEQAFAEGQAPWPAVEQVRTAEQQAEITLRHAMKKHDETAAAIAEVERHDKIRRLEELRELASHERLAERIHELAPDFVRLATELDELVGKAIAAEDDRQAAHAEAAALATEVGARLGIERPRPGSARALLAYSLHQALAGGRAARGNWLWFAADPKVAQAEVVKSLAGLEPSQVVGMGFALDEAADLAALGRLCAEYSSRANERSEATLRQREEYAQAEREAAGGAR